MNCIHFLGRLTVDPELRQTPNNQSMARFRIAVKRLKGNDDFFNVISWGKTAEFVNQYFHKGERIIIHGELHENNYNDPNGIKHYGVEVTANSVEFADTKEKNESPPSNHNPTTNQQDYDYPV